ncbi:MAG: PAS domain-containing protein [Candidatus Ozemobacteraceae bacterium]
MTNTPPDAIATHLTMPISFPAPDWTEEFPGAITVTDTQGIILSMNRRARETFEKPGQESLIGKSLFGCHPEPARTRLREMYAAPRPNSYTVSKKGVKKFIHQAPWYKEGVYGGYVELSLIIPEAMPHHDRA